MIKLKSPGMRTIKTSLIVAICLILSKLLNLDYPFYAIVAGIICTQNTLHGSFNIAKNRVIGTVIGSLLGIICVNIFSYNPWTGGIGILILLYLLRVVKLEDSYRVACIVYLATFIPGHGDPIIYGFHRTAATIIGIIIALIVNLIVYPPQYSNDIKKLSYDLVNNLIKLCGNFFIHDKNVDLSSIGSSIFNIETLMKNYKLDIIKSKIETIDIEKFDALIFDSKKLYNHMGIINELTEQGHSCKLNEVNSSNLSKLYNQESPIRRYEKDYHDDIFNYHIEKIVKYLDQLKDLRLD